MKKLLLFTVVSLFFIVNNISAQHFIGLNKNETRVLAKKTGFYADDMIMHKKFNYLKFVNSSDTKTFIVFFSDKDISTHTRTVCDYSEYDFVISDFNEQYKKKSKNLWEYKVDKEIFKVTLEEEEWYFVLRVKKK